VRASRRCSFGHVVDFYVDDVDAIADEFGATVQTEACAREIDFTDPDSNMLRMGTRSSD
jgi:hypothetical protein